MNKLSIEIRISIIVFLAAVFGIISEFIPYGNYINSEVSYTLVSAVNSLFSTIRLTFFYTRIFEYSNFDSDVRINVLHIFIYLTAFIGGILYLVSKQKESRLIRFFFSIVLLTTSLFLLSTTGSLVYAIVKFHTFKVLWIVLLIPFLLWFYLSYWVLKQLHKAKIPDNISPTPNDSNSIFFLVASKWQRFFHLVFDTIFCILIFSTFTGVLKIHFLDKVASETSEKFVMYVLLYIFRLIYYPFWETLFGATPGKFLTETRVLNMDGTKIGFKKALLRTLSRFIPFEPFSFFGNEGWHDNLTQTQVVSEKRTGMLGGFYFLIIPLFLILGFGSYYGHDAYREHQSHVYYKKVYDLNISAIEKALENLSTDHLIKIKEVKNYSSNNPYLKVEKIKDDNILVSIVPEDSHFYSSQLHYAQAYYKYYSDTLTRIVVKKSLLMQAYTKNYDDHEANRKQSTDLLNDGKDYEIEYIDLLYAPKLEGGSSSLSGESIDLSIKNIGWAAKIIDIKNIEGSVKWLNPIPDRIESTMGYNDYSLRGKYSKRGEYYKVRLVLEDSLKRKQSYILEGKNLNRTLIKEN